VASAEQNDNSKAFLAALQELMDRYPVMRSPSDRNYSVSELMNREQQRQMFYVHLQRLVEKYKDSGVIVAAPIKTQPKLSEDSTAEKDFAQPSDPSAQFDHAGALELAGQTEDLQTQETLPLTFEGEMSRTSHLFIS
jgi:hypothetical protein